MAAAAAGRCWHLEVASGQALGCRRAVWDRPRLGARSARGVHGGWRRSRRRGRDLPVMRQRTGSPRPVMLPTAKAVGCAWARRPRSTGLAATMGQPGFSASRNVSVNSRCRPPWPLR